MKKALLAAMGILVATTLCRAQSAPTAKPHEHHWESNLSGGYIDYVAGDETSGGMIDNMNRHIALVKSFWFYPFLPRIVALGASFDYVTDDLPLSLNVSLNAPLKTVVPFVSAGVGASISGSSLRNAGGGIKVRLGQHMGVVAEYRFYRVRKKTLMTVPGESQSYVVRRSNYFGAGIAYLY